MNRWLVLAVIPTWMAFASSVSAQTRSGSSGDGPRVLVYHDMEGLSGQDDWRTFEYRHRDHYPRGQKMLVADVNAVVAGLFEGGASRVDVVDAHGSGNPEPDLLLDELDERAGFVWRDEPFRPYVDLTEPGAYDAVAAVGMHAKTGSGGFASHTYTLGMDVILNGRSLTETEIIAYSWGRVGVPVIFASGDDRLARDLETLPWIEFVTVKRATSASSAEIRPVEEARAELRAKARRAVENLDRARPVTLSAPIDAALRAVPPASLEPLEGVPGIEYADHRVRFQARDFQEAYDGVVALMRVASLGSRRLLFEAVREHPDSDEIFWSFEEKLMGRWMDYESGRWAPPEPETRTDRRRYHGAR